MTTQPKEVVRIIGGAGSGKTSRLMAEIDAAATRYGGLDAVGFSSMTRAARAEAVSRAAKAFGAAEGELTREGWFRTLHGVAFASLGVSSGSVLADDARGEAWLREEAFPGHSWGPPAGTQIVTRRKVTPDVAINVWTFARSCVAPLAAACKFFGVPFAKVAPLADQYETAKRVHGLVDFPDLMMQFVGCRYPTIGDRPARVDPRGETPDVAVWLFDESQDMSRLCDLVARRLASTESVERVVLVGDPFQSIFGFAGSSSRWMMGWPARQEIMPTSHRCPRQILEAGEGRLRHLKAGEYWDRGIAASRDGGTLASTPSIRNMLAGVNAGDEWLLLARSNYQAKKIADEADRAGIPWTWTRGESDDTLAVRRAGFRAAVMLERGGSIEPHWVEALFAAIPTVSAGVRLWDHGAKSRFAVQQREPGARFSRADLPALGATPELAAAFSGSGWVSLARDGATRYRDTAARHGEELAERPRVKIGTIHSVKGFEADNVGILHAPTAASVKQQRRSREIYNEERRIEYVAITRARARVVACYPPCTGTGSRRLW